MSNSIATASLYTGCFECDYEAEFHGSIDSHDVAHFPCQGCGQTFTVANWSNFWDEEEED